MNKVVVIGGDHHNTLGVLRGLGERGINSDLILVSKGKRSFVGASKYVDNVYRACNDDEIINVLLSNDNESEKPVVICCSDTSSGVIDEHYDLLKKKFYLPGGSRSGEISALMNKQKMAELATSIGLSIPQTYMFDECTTEDKVSLPCIIKPLISRKGKKADIVVCHTKEQLKDFLSKNNPQNFIIQDFIDKDFEYQLIGCSTKQRGVVIPGVSIIMRPCKGSNTSFLHYIPLSKDFCEISKAIEFVEKTGYKGLFSLEFLRDKNGKDYFMEMNFRNDGNAICVTASGLSLPYIWYLDCVGGDLVEEMNNTVNPVYVMPDMAELKLLFTRQINLSQFVSDFKRTNRFMEFDKKDIKPFIYLLLKELHL